VALALLVTFSHAIDTKNYKPKSCLEDFELTGNRTCYASSLLFFPNANCGEGGKVCTLHKTRKHDLSITAALMIVAESNGKINLTYVNDKLEKIWDEFMDHAYKGADKCHDNFGVPFVIHATSIEEFKRKIDAVTDLILYVSTEHSRNCNMNSANFGYQSTRIYM
ncbi:hypothetical protein PFISCL1PPCAC_15926, partial [Pristionchus fissidentatus]